MADTHLEMFIITVDEEERYLKAFFRFLHVTSLMRSGAKVI